MKIETFQTEPEWLAARMLGVGASQCPMLLRASNTGSPMSVWLEKTTGARPMWTPRQEELLYWGKAAEDMVARRYEVVTGRSVIKNLGPYTIRRHDTVPLFATLDYELHGGGILEIKNVDSSQAEQWDDDAPVSYQVQLQAQMAVTGQEWGVVCGLIGGNRLMPYEYRRDEGFIGELLEHVTEFWRLVETNTPPIPDGSEATKAALHRLYPRHTKGARVTLPPEAEVWYRIRADGKAAIKAAQAKIDEAEAEIKAAMKDAEVGEIPGIGEVTWKAQEQAEYIVKAMTKRVLRVKGERS